MNTCDTCKHYRMVNDILAKFARRKMYEGLVLCDKLSLQQGKPEIDGIATRDYLEASSYDIVPGPKFGCVHWEVDLLKPSQGIIVRIEGEFAVVWCPETHRNGLINIADWETRHGKVFVGRPVILQSTFKDENGLTFDAILPADHEAKES